MTAHDDSLAWPPWLTMDRAVAYTGLSRCTLKRAIRCGELRCSHPGGHRRVVIRRADLDEWLGQGASLGPAPEDVEPPRVRTREAADASVTSAIARVRAIAGGRSGS